jgi:hypothetical protein
MLPLVMAHALPMGLRGLALAALYTAPVLFVTHQMEYAAIAGAVVLVLTVVLVFTWWPHLPKAERL